MPRKRKLFHGWLIVVCSFITNAIVFGAGSASFSVFMGPMTQALGWSRTIFTGALTLQNLVNLFVYPVVGIIIDRFGPRLVMVTGAVIATVCYLLIGNVTEPWQFYVLYAGAVSLGLHEIGSLVTTVVVSKWFIRMRGRALAIIVAGNNVGTILFAPFSAFLISSIGWRSAWALLGTFIAVIVLPPTILFMRRTPEDMGLLPDGDEPEVASVNADGSPRPPSNRREEVSWSVGEALRTRSLWLMVVSTNLASLGIASAVHSIPYFQDIGMPLQAATFVFVLNHVSGIVSKLVWGIIAERIPVRYCLMGNYLGRSVATFILVFGTGVERAYIFSIMSGLLGNAFAVLQAQIWADYYGRTFLGTIRGILTPFTLMASIGGPLFAAYVYDRAGSYDAAFVVFAVTFALAAIILFYATPPQKKQEATLSTEALTR